MARVRVEKAVVEDSSSAEQGNPDGRQWDPKLEKQARWK